MRRNFDPPDPPEYPQCPFCDGPLEDKGMLNFHDWVCVNPDCEHSDCYQEAEECTDATTS